MGYNPYDPNNIKTEVSTNNPLYPTNPVLSRAPQVNSLIESFEWYTKEFSSHDAGPNRVRLKITSAHAGAISKNGRQYVEEALVKSCNTWMNKPICVNHDINKKIGTIELTEFEDGKLEHVAIIVKEPYVSAFRNHSPEIKGFSLGANYLYNKCAKCGEKFLSEKEWHDHMTKEHLIKDIPTQPHGIIATELSVVYGKEVPGLETNWEIAETANGFNKLCESVLSDHLLVASSATSTTPEANQATITQTIVTADPISEKLELTKQAPEPYRSAFKYLLKKADETVTYYRGEMEKTPEYQEQQRLIKESAAQHAVELKESADKLEKLETEKTALNTQLTEINQKLSALEAAHVLKLKETELTVEFQKATCETLQKQLSEQQTTINTLNEKLQGKAEAEEKLSFQQKLTAELTETQTRQADEITQLKAKLAEKNQKITEYENQLDKVKPSFKGNAKATVKKLESPLSFNPYAYNAEKPNSVVPYNVRGGETC